MKVTLLDGPMGTELSARGVATDLPRWSASAIDESPQTIAAIHRDYALAGATVHTANTFRTKRRTVGDDWQRLAREAVRLASEAVRLAREAVRLDREAVQLVGGSEDVRIAGSISPLEDCYRPDLSPPQPRDEHRELAELLAEAGCDLLLCETFPNVAEAVVAVQEAVRTGVETWVAMTAGPQANLLTPAAMAEGAKRAVDAGATAAMVNCTPATETLRFLVALQQAKLGVPIGAYANAGSPCDKIGWAASSQQGAKAYVLLARQWVDAGATIIGSCCGTGPSHIAALADEFAD